MTKILGTILDSTGRPANGNLYVRQTARFSTAAGLVTQTRVVAPVVAGVPYNPDRTELELPPSPENVLVEFVEDFRDGTQVSRFVSIPDVAQVEYGALFDVIPPVNLDVVPGWVVEVLAATGEAAASAAAADQARIAAEAAQAAAEAVPTTSDSITAGLINTPGSETETALSATYVAIQTVDLASFLLPGESMPNDGAADAKPLFQRAVDAVGAAYSAQGPKVIRIPPGRYRINSNVNWAPGAGVVGAGRGATTILPYGPAVFGYTPAGWVDGETFDEVYWADLTIDCINQSYAGEQVGVKGVSIRWLKNSRFERVRVVDSWATSFGCDFLQDVVFDSCTAIRSGRGNVTFETFGAGFGIGVGNFDRESVTLINCYAEGCASSGFFVERLINLPTGNREALGLSMTSCTAAGCNDGFHDMGATAFTVNGCQFLDNTRAGIYINGGSASGRHGGKDGRVQNSVIRGNGDGILATLAATGAYTLTGCDISENTGAGFTTGSSPQIGAGWRFLNSTIERNGAGGIIFLAPLANQFEASGCRIRENGAGDGISLSGDAIEPRIVGNVIQGHLGAGVRFSGATRVCWDPIVKDNVLTENRDGGFVNEKVTNSTTGVTGNRETAAFTTLTNFFAIPSYEASVAQISVVSNFDAPAQVVGPAPAGAAFARLTVTANGTATARVNRRTSGLSGTYIESAWVRAAPGAVIRLTAVGYWPAVTSRSWHKGGIRATGDWQRVHIGLVLPVGATQVDLNVSVDGAKAGDQLDVDASALTPGTVLWPYWDGDTLPAAGGAVAWASTPHGSPSVWTLPTA